MRISILFFLVLCLNIPTFSQNFNIQEVTKAKLVNVSGGASANTIVRTVNDASNPFSYFLNGNITVNIAGLYSLPFSFSYTNQKFGYNKPVLMNRLSIHPSYKWITAHIGDANMTFSPYTLSGHQFSGFGIDLTPQGKFKISAMYGRFTKKSEYDPNTTQLPPVYKRMGYGFKTKYAFSNLNLGFSFLKVNDLANSLEVAFPQEFGLAPKENVALSLDASFTLFKKLQINTELGNSSITEDVRKNSTTKAKGIASFFLTPNSTTNNTKAVKANLVYPAGNGTLGFGYERIDPNYRTLGGYYFNNDMENITVNATQSLYKNKLSLGINVGLQKDNIKQQKQTQMKRLVSSITSDFKANQKLNLNFSYSNFQSYTNSRNQFDYINQTNDLEQLDTLNYRQVSQNASLAANYLLGKSQKRKQNINLSFSLQDAINEQEGQKTAEGTNTTYNTNLSYSLGFPNQNFTINTALNSSQNTAVNNKSFTWGPTLGANKLLFDKKLNTNFAASYNTGKNNGVQQNQTINLRLNGSYVYAQKHNFSVSAISLFATTATTKTSNFTATLGYTYSFDKIKIKPTKKETAPKTDDTNDVTENDAVLKIKYKNTNLEGTKTEIIKELEALQQDLDNSTNEAKIAETKRLGVQDTLDEKEFKNAVLDYLEDYQIASKTPQKKPEIAAEIQKSATKPKIKVPKAANNTAATIELRKAKTTSNALLTLKKHLDNIAPNYELPNKIAQARVTNHKMHLQNPDTITNKNSYYSYLKLVARAKISQDKTNAFIWIKDQINQLETTMTNGTYNDPNFALFMQNETTAINGFIETKKSDLFIVNYLEKRLFDYYKNLATKKFTAINN